MSATRTRAVGTPLDRIDGPEKVTGNARYAFEQRVDHPAYLYPIESTIATGRIVAIDVSAAIAEQGVVAVLTHENAPKLASTADRELAILQSDMVAFRGQFIGGVVAESSEIARHAASLVRIEYEAQAGDLALRDDGSDLYVPKALNAGFATDTAEGDIDAALATSAVTLDASYTTPMEHANPMETNPDVAIWYDDGLTLYCASQGVRFIQAALAPALGLDAQRIRVISPHVGGGFGCRCLPYADVMLAVMAAQLIAGRPVKLALTRQQMFTQVGYRAPSSQRIRLGADADGRLTAIAHDVVQPTAKIKEFVEQTAVATRMMYAAPNRRTTHRVAALDVPAPNQVRGPGDTPGMFALESAMDEMALACGMDPIEFRIRNEPEVDPESGLPFSSRHLVRCLRDGAGRFGWETRDPTPRSRRDGEWFVGTGVAVSTYPTFLIPGNTATIRASSDGRYTVSIAAADIGTGARTVLTQIAADALGVSVEDVEVRMGDSALPMAFIAGGSAGTASWGAAIVGAASALRTRLESDHAGVVPTEGLEVTVDMVADHAGPLPGSPYKEKYAMYAFGAQFAEVRVNANTGEVRVPRLLGTFDVGRMINPKLGRSQLLGGMTWGLSMALHEHSVLDPRFGHVVNHDFAGYHIAACADVGSVEVHWLDEHDPHTNPMGSKGIGELGIVGTAAAIANAVYHATGIRVRDLPITLDKLLR
jgi:xanthine dehydrogenase YagR molybdenum-binding subunit